MVTVAFNGKAHKVIRVTFGKKNGKTPLASMQ